VRQGIRQAALAQLQGWPFPVRLARRGRPRPRYSSAERLRFLSESVYVAKPVAIPPTMLLGFLAIRLFVFRPALDAKG